MIEITILSNVNDSVERSYTIKRGISNAKARRDSKIRRDLKKTWRYRSLVAANFNRELSR